MSGGVGAVGPAAMYGVTSHRGGGQFVPMSTHGSASRVMSPASRRPTTAPGLRHGSAELGGSPSGPNRPPGRRDRERDRDRIRSRGIPPVRQMGPQETADWDDLIGKIITALILSNEMSGIMHKSMARRMWPQPK